MIRIITDSSSELDPELAAQLQVDVIPIHIFFGETEYLDRQTLSVTDFYQKLDQTDKLPTTSQITPFQFYQVFQPYVEAGDEIVGIFLSSQLSGTFQSAQAGKVRGHKAAHRWMQQQLEKEPADAQYPVVFSHSVNLQGRDEMIETLDSFLPNQDYLYCDLGSTVGAHIGPGAIGFAYIAE